MYYEEQVVRYTIGNAVLTVLGGVIGFARQSSFSLIGEHIIRTIKIDLYGKILKLPVSWF